jgi:hypothetical protein
VRVEEEWVLDKATNRIKMVQYEVPRHKKSDSTKPIVSGDDGDNRKLEKELGKKIESQRLEHMRMNLVISAIKEIRSFVKGMRSALKFVLISCSISIAVVQARTVKFN